MPDNPLPLQEKQSKFFYWFLRSAFRRFFSVSAILLFLLIIPSLGNAQEVFQARELAKEVSLHPYARFANVGEEGITLTQLRNNPGLVEFITIESENPNIGFTSDQYWATLKMQNPTDKHFTYYLETARPITDRVDLYTVNRSGAVMHQQSGDNMRFVDRSYNHRKTIFQIDLPPDEELDLFVRYESDGEVLNLPLVLHDASTLLRTTYFEQLIFGIFFGLLFLAAVIYLFFFFALRERSFLYYSLYVISVGLLQFSLDGYFYQYVDPSGSWLALHSVVVFAIISAGCLARYAEVYLNIVKSSTFLPKLFKAIYVLLAILLGAVILWPATLEFSYPMVNILGLVVLIAIITSLVILFSKRISVDKYFVTGIFFLVLGFVLFILNNLSILPNNFITQNSAKLGTGLEIIFLSLSMSNRIRKLKSENEQMQNLALIRLLEMNDLKSYFLSNLSHELRTPLNAIMGLADSMINETKDQKIRNTSNIIKASSVRLLNLINDILDFSKIEKGELKLEKEVFNPADILEQLRISYKNQADEKGLVFYYKELNTISVPVLGDANRLAQMINNLLDNAFKFTPEGTVSFTVRTLPQKDKSISFIFTISDTGVGIPKDKMDSIFDSLTQENISNKRTYGGLGLGLYIIKILVDMHQGDIQITSDSSGTTCVLRLTYEPTPVLYQPRKQFPRDTYDLLGTRILAVEDNIMNQMVLKMIAKQWQGTEISFANHGEEALQMLRENTYDLILMDLQMPIMDGYETTIAIRKGEAGEENRTLPIIAVTADVMESTKDRVLQIGMDDYLAKPVNKDGLYQKIISLLESEKAPA